MHRHSWRRVLVIASSGLGVFAGAVAALARAGGGEGYHGGGSGGGGGHGGGGGGGGGGGDIFDLIWLLFQIIRLIVIYPYIGLPVTAIVVFFIYRAYNTVDDSRT